MAENTMHYDAIVVGSGISGGWAAKELTEKGLKVLMLSADATSSTSRITRPQTWTHGISTPRKTYHRAERP